ncbi:MAG: hypothetical protein Q4G59_08710, partial [Planctomycetia bacterium]|nr:hypothetical protein [Planctomycetia bacterium]
LFDVIWSYGCHWNLDGMFDAAPINSQLAYKHFLQGDRTEGTRYMNRILDLRDALVRYDVFPAFTAVMNLLGYDGMYHPDYMTSVSDEAKEALGAKLVEIGEL